MKESESVYFIPRTLFLSLAIIVLLIQSAFAATPDTISLVVKKPAIPTVKITAPANNASFFGPLTINITANAAVTNGRVQKVQFFNGNTLLGTDTASPYTYVWKNVPAGTYKLRAKAFNIVGNYAFSSIVTVTVRNPIPSVALTTPINNASLTAPAKVVLTANAKVSIGGIRKVEFYNGSSLLGTTTIAPYRFVWRNIVPGNYVFTAKAYSKASMVGTSSPVNFNYVGIPARAFLTPSQHDLLVEMLDTHLNYFLSPDVISASGLPLGGYKEGNRARYNYSNPTEWGYALQAWIIASDNKKVDITVAKAYIAKALTTIRLLQTDPSQNYQKLFYPYYNTTDSFGNDLAKPQHDGNTQIPSIDNGFLYTSLNIVKGWAKANYLESVETLAGQIMTDMNFRMFLRPDGLYMAHLVNAVNGQQSSSKWDVYSDEGGMMAWIAYLSDSITLSEYKQLIKSMIRFSRSYAGITVSEATWFNSMFTWGVRSWAGFPISTLESNIFNRYSYSFSNSVDAHLLYGKGLGVDYPAFSDAMTQANMVGRYTPPNISNTVPTDIPAHVTAHAFFVPFLLGTDLHKDSLETLVSKIMDLKSDMAGYYHRGQDNHKPFGFEVTTSPLKNHTTYPGVESRYIYETIGTAYIVMSLYQGLDINDGKPAFYHYASQVNGYAAKVSSVLDFLYSRNTLYVPEDYSTIQSAIDAAQSGDVIKVAANTYTEAIILNKSGITLQGEPGAILQNTPAPAITARNLFGPMTKITGFSISGDIKSEGTVKSLTIESNNFTSGGVYLVNGAVVDIKSNSFKNGSVAIYSEGNNTVNILNNKIDGYLQSLGGGINLRNTTALIEANTISNGWDGAINLSNNSKAKILKNTIIHNGSWELSPGLNIADSEALIDNNLIINNDTSNAGKAGGISAQNSSLTLINNVFTDNSGKASAQIYVENTPIIFKNNILNNTTSLPQFSFNGAGVVNFLYNDLWPTANIVGVIPDNTNITVDPKFISDTDFHLQPTSACRNAGDPDSSFNDKDGTRNDMGIYGGLNPFQ